MDLYNEENYWRMKSAEWKQKYDELQATLYNQWTRHQKQHDQLMEKIAAQQTNESDYIQKLEDENAQLRAELKRENE